MAFVVLTSCANRAVISFILNTCDGRKSVEEPRTERRCVALSGMGGLGLFETHKHFCAINAIGSVLVYCLVLKQCRRAAINKDLLFIWFVMLQSALDLSTLTSHARRQKKKKK